MEPDGGVRLAAEERYLSGEMREKEEIGIVPIQARI